MRFCPLTTGPLHFIGIGGIGMSGVADILHSLGYQVGGSDAVQSPNSERLRSKGISISIGHKAEHIPECAVVVISSAIKETNPELIEARRRGLLVVKRAEMLAEIMRLKPAIAVGGTHGKTTTTSLIGTLLASGGMDPTIVSGGIINAYGTNARLGSGEWVVAEADESDGTFTKLPATIAVVTNVEPEHMEFYGSLEKLHQAFLRFIENTPFYGVTVLCLDDTGVQTLLPHITDRRTITYGVHKDSDVRLVLCSSSAEGLVFDFHFSERFLKVYPSYKGGAYLENIALPMIGIHNMLNAAAALIVALQVGLSIDEIKEGFRLFKGVKRRFTVLGSVDGMICVDDYAHHPTEIKMVLKGAKSMTQGRVIAVIQPHRYSRLSHLFSDFSKCCQDADEVIVTPVYSAGEEPLSLDHRSLQEAISIHKGHKVYGIEQQEDLVPLLKNLGKSGDTIVFMGAGSISSWAKEAVAQW